MVMQSDIKNDSSFETKKTGAYAPVFFESIKDLVAGNRFDKALGVAVVVLVNTRHRNDGV